MLQIDPWERPRGRADSAVGKCGSSDRVLTQSSKQSSGQGMNELPCYVHGSASVVLDVAGGADENRGLRQPVATLLFANEEQDRRPPRDVAE